VRSWSILAIALAGACACSAQEWEIGGAAGYGIYHNGHVYGPNMTSVQAGIQNRFVVSAVATDHAYDHFSGELRYTYHDGDPFLAAGGVQTNRQGQSHALHYYITPFPKKLIAAAPLNTPSGIFHQITPMLGIGCLF